MTVLATLQHRLRGHTCYEGCEDLLCLAAREIEAEGARLDWLEAFARQSRDGLLLHALSSTGRTGLGLTHRPLRAAIDAARNATQEKP